MNTTLVNIENLQNLTACHACDLLVEHRKVPLGSKASCPRCGTTIAEPKSDTVDKTLALALTGLILFIPAMMRPVLSMTIMGKTSSNTLVNGVVDMWQGGFYLVAFLVCAFSIAAPFLKLLILSIVLLQVKLQLRSRSLPVLFRAYAWLDPWAMIEVYLLGIVVSAIKLVDMARLIPGPGLYCVAGLLLVSILAALSLDEHTLWRKIEELCPPQTR